MVDKSEVGRVEMRTGTKGKVLASLTKAGEYWILRADGETTLRFDYEDGLRALLASMSGQKDAMETAASAAGTARPTSEPARARAARSC